MTFLTRRLGPVEASLAHEENPSKTAILRAEASSIITQIGILQQKLAD